MEGEAVGGHGYWNQPALTAECFVPNLFGAPGSRLFRTGEITSRAINASIARDWAAVSRPQIYYSLDPAGVRALRHTVARLAA